MLNRIGAVLVVGMFVPAVVVGQVKKPQDIEVSPHWIYDDVPAAFAQAKQSGKPLLALFR
jgi:hypothetical protein